MFRCTMECSNEWLRPLIVLGSLPVCRQSASQASEDSITSSIILAATEQLLETLTLLRSSLAPIVKDGTCPTARSPGRGRARPAPCRKACREEEKEEKEEEKVVGQTWCGS